MWRVANRERNWGYALHNGCMKVAQGKGFLIRYAMVIGAGRFPAILIDRKAPVTSDRLKSDPSLLSIRRLDSAGVLLSLVRVIISSSTIVSAVLRPRDSPCPNRQILQRTLMNCFIESTHTFTDSILNSIKHSEIAYIYACPTRISVFF